MSTQVGIPINRMREANRGRWPWVDRGDSMSRKLRAAWSGETGTGKDISGGGKDLTIEQGFGGPFFDSTPFGRGFMTRADELVRSTDDLLNLGGPEMAISCWMLWAPTQNNVPILQHEALLATRRTNFFTRASSSLRIAVFPGGTLPSEVLDYPEANLPTHRFFNVVWTYGSPRFTNKNRMYINGELVASAPGGTTGINTITGSGSVFQGWFMNAGVGTYENDEGTVALMAIWDRALSDAEIKRHYRTMAPFLLPRPIRLSGLEPRKMVPAQRRLDVDRPQAEVVAY